MLRTKAVARRETVVVVENKPNLRSPLLTIHNPGPAKKIKRLNAEDETDRAGSQGTYDPSVHDTAVVQSKIVQTYINGLDGVLRYRGYRSWSIEQLVEISNLLIYGDLPTNGDSMMNAQGEVMQGEVIHHIHSDIENMFKFVPLRLASNPMLMAFATLGAFAPEAPEATPTLSGNMDSLNDASDKQDSLEILERLLLRLLVQNATGPTASTALRQGLSYNRPGNFLSSPGYFLSEPDYQPHPDFLPRPVLDKLLDILHADHEVNEVHRHTCTVLEVGGSLQRCFCVGCAALAVLYGGASESASESAIRSDPENGSPAFMQAVRERVLVGDRVYKNVDPRVNSHVEARRGSLRKVTEQVLEVTGPDKLADYARKSAEFMRSRNLYPNVDFYSGLIYHSRLIYPVLAVPLDVCVGKLAHWRPRMLERGRGSMLIPRHRNVGEARCYCFDAEHGGEKQRATVLAASVRAEHDIIAAYFYRQVGVVVKRGMARKTIVAYAERTGGGVVERGQWQGQKSVVDS
ncbi:hypothetical protein CEK25_012546 [Fusarium fujikuroi]|nr:hypothetical protein CEK25_012546 [Fusarium fujikuroi]